MKPFCRPETVWNIGNQYIFSVTDNEIGFKLQTVNFAVGCTTLLNRP